MKNYATFEQAERLNNKGIKFGEPKFGDLYYTVHPDTGVIDNVLVGSAKWYISEMLPMFRGPSLHDLLEYIGYEYAIRFEHKHNYWVLEKTIFYDFTSEDYDYISTSIPIGCHKCPFTLIIDFICG
jgi:hypothetical protein